MLFVRLAVSFYIIFASFISVLPRQLFAGARTVRAVSTTFTRGLTNTLSIELDAQGDENGVAFSVNFDATILSNPTATLGTGATGATLLQNNSQAALGRFGVAVGLPIPTTFAAGTKQVVTITFNTEGTIGASTTPITFGDAPVTRETSDASAGVLPTAYTNGMITLTGGTYPAPTISSINPSSAMTGGAAFTLTVNGTGYVDGATVVQWKGVNKTTTFVSGTQLTAAIPATDIADGGTASVTVNNPTPGGGTSAGQTFTINNPVPTTSGTSPSTVEVGGAAFTLTVNGGNFVPSSSVQWNAVSKTTTFVSSTQLTASIAAADIASTGTANVTVVNASPGGGTSNAQTVAINNPVPTISGLNPTGVKVGGAAFTLTVNGTKFVSSSQVQWNGSGRSTTFVSSTQLTASIPASDIASETTANITVFNPTPGGGASNTVTFSVTLQPPPTLTSISPTSATAGGAAFMLTVNGSDFIATSVVRWNGADRTTTYVSATQMTASIPATDIAAAGTVSVTVYTPAPGGGSSAAQTFTINNPIPTTTSISPTSAIVGGAAFTLTVNGTNFVNGSVVRWNGVDRTTTYVNGTQLTAEIAAADIATTGTVNVTVFNPTPGGGASSAQTFTINNPVPTTTSISPTSATAGDAGFTLTVNGTNFVAASVVKWNGVSKTTTFVSATQLTASIAAGDVAVAGAMNVTVFNPTPGGGASNAQTFTVNNPVPTTSGITPSTVSAGGDAFALTVNGTRFVAGSIVRWNSSNRATTYVSATQLTATINAADYAAAGTASITVFNPTPGGGASNAQTLTINNPVPVIASISPNSATRGGAAFNLNVYGSRFVSASVVTWNGSSRTTTLISSTQLAAAIPASDIATSGDYSITVVNPAPGGGTSNAMSFTVADRPCVFSLTPTSKSFPAGGGSDTVAVTASAPTCAWSAISNNSWISVTAGAGGTGNGSVSYTVGANSSSDARNGTLSIGGNTFNVSQSGSSSIDTTLPGGSGSSQQSSGDGPLSVFYGQISSTNPSWPVVLAIFGLTETTTNKANREEVASPVLVTEAGVPAASPISRARLFVDYGSGNDSGLAIVNPNDLPITLDLELRDAAGTVAGTAQMTVPAKGHVAQFVSQMGLNLPVTFLGTLTIVGNTSLITNNTFAAVNLRSATSGHGEMLFSALPVANLDSPPAGTRLLFPQIVDGGGVPTQVLLMNPSATASSTGTIKLFDDNGAPLALDFGPGVGLQSVLNFALAPNGMAKFSTTGAGSLKVGYAVVSVTTGPLPVGNGIFSANGAGGMASQAGVPDAPQTTSARIYVDMNSTPIVSNTGIAIVNPGSTTATVMLTLIDCAGGATRNYTLSIPSGGHIAKFVNQIFTDLPADFDGVLTLASDVPISPLTLRLTTNQRGESIYSTLPVADLNNPPVGPLYIPQVVDGGGYRTQFIMLNTSSTAKAVHIDFVR